MFKRVSEFVRKAIARMFSKQSIESVIGEKSLLSSDMVKSIELWRDMYIGNAPWCNDDEVISTRLEQGIVRELANICLNEMDSNVTNNSLDALYQNAIWRLNEYLQAGLALGSFIIKPLGMGHDVEFVTADKFVPLAFDSAGRLTSTAFIDARRNGDTGWYVRIEKHTLIGQKLTITNSAYMSSDMATLGNAIPLSYVDDWAQLPEEVSFTGVEKPLFGYYVNPVHNIFENDNLGVSLYDVAIDLIHRLDVQCSRYDWEFDSGARAIHVDELALRIKGTQQKIRLPKHQDRLYRGLNFDSSDLFKDYSPEFREEALREGIQQYKRDIEDAVGLARGDLSDVQEQKKTATEVSSSMQRKYNTVKAIQRNLHDCLEDLVYALAFYNRLTQAGYEFICDFHDSILTDEVSARQFMLDEIAAGVRTPESYIAKRDGISEKEALKLLPNASGGEDEN